MIKGLQIDLWVLVIRTKPLQGYFLNTEAVSYIGTFPNSCRSSGARAPTEHRNFLFVCFAVTHSKTSGNLPNLQGPKFTEFRAKHKNGKAQFPGKSCASRCQVLQVSQLHLPPASTGPRAGGSCAARSLMESRGLGEMHV